MDWIPAVCRDSNFAAGEVRRPETRAQPADPGCGAQRRRRVSRSNEGGVPGEADHASRLRAGDGTRTRDIQLGKLTLYQLSYTRAKRTV